jgi:hypothetical protein
MQKLVSSFTTSSWIPSCKSLVSFLKTLDKKIPNFQLYFNAKKYNSTNKVTLSDKDRYDVLFEQIIGHIHQEESFKVFVTDHYKWIVELGDFIKSENVYNLLSANFIKGSYGKMIDDLNRILVPKKSGDDDDEETEDPTEGLKKYIKNYSQDFDKVVEEYALNEYKLYKSIHMNQEDDDTPIKEEMLKIEVPVFSIYAFRNVWSEELNVTRNKLLGLWISEKPLEFEEIELDEYLELVSNIPFNLNPEHLTNMDTIKRNYINKQFDLFQAHVNLLVRSNALYFYKGSYLHSSDYDTYNELQFSNAVNSFPTSYEDYTRNAFAIFYFDKNENVSIETFWITSKPIEQVLSEYDRGLYNWETSTSEEFLSSSDLYKDASHSMLH